jgi:pimeloyl-ACP methyl ester carboxylesterase
MPFITVNGLKLCYEMHGEGESIVLLHHGFGCLKMWKDIFPPLVQAGYRVVLYDRRGFGQSERPPDFMEFYVGDRFREENVKDLEGLLTGLGIGPCHLVGQCEGGVVAVEYAALHPELVRSVVTSSTQCYSTVPMTELNHAKFTKSFDQLDPQLRARYMDWHGQDTRVLFEQFRSYGGEYGSDIFDLRDCLRTVTCPALVLYPDRSFLFDVEQGLAFYKHMPNGELMVLPNCGHNTYEERPGEYVRAVLDFQQRVKSPVPRHRARITCAA